MMIQTDPSGEQGNPIRTSFIQQVKVWCNGQQWWWRLGLLLWFAFVFSNLLQKPDAWTLFSPLNLAIHEMGHVVFAGTGQFMAVAGGTILQLSAPWIGMLNFYRQMDFFAMALCLGWLSTNLFNVSIYMADARSQQLHLVSLGRGEAIHDWNYLFSHTGLLLYDQVIAGFVWFLAVLMMLACFFTGGFLILQMARSPKGSKQLDRS